MKTDTELLNWVLDNLEIVDVSRSAMVTGVGCGCCSWCFNSKIDTSIGDTRDRQRKALEVAINEAKKTITKV